MYLLMGTLQTHILGAQRAPLFIPIPALCHDVGNVCEHGTRPVRCLLQCLGDPQICLLTFTKTRHIRGFAIVSQYLMLTVHKPVKQIWLNRVEFVYTCQRFLCARVGIAKLSFQGVFPSPFTSHLFPLHVTCNKVLF